jgi:hypothetical protein
LAESHARSTHPPSFHVVIADENGLPPTIRVGHCCFIDPPQIVLAPAYREWRMIVVRMVRPNVRPIVV